MPLFFYVIKCHYMSLYAAELNVRQAGWWSELDVICHSISLYAIICQYMPLYVLISHYMSLYHIMTYNDIQCFIQNIVFYSEYRYSSLYGHNIVTYGGVNCHNIVAYGELTMYVSICLECPCGQTVVWPWPQPTKEPQKNHKSCSSHYMS